ncbi:MAG: dephospho-CoA kinase [Bacteroidota bacterium]
MLKIGITGGIGSGKTTVCKIFETLGIPVYYADERAKGLMINNAPLVLAIKKLLGEKAYDEKGQLNRKWIANKVFNDKSLLEGLNQLVHPAVHEDGDRWHEEQVDVPYTLKEAALIFESNGHLHLDKIITVTAPKEIRIQRVMARDQVMRAAVEARMDKQMPEAEKVKRSDFVIYNDGKHSLIQQVLKIHQSLANNEV